MKGSLVYRVELSQIFPEEVGKTVQDYLNGISKEFILKTGAYLIAFEKDSEYTSNNKKVIEDWFRRDNQEVAQFIYDRIVQIEKKNNWVARIINAHATLKLLETAFAGESKTTTQSEPEMEINMFKAYILLNEIDNQKDNSLFASLEGVEEGLKFSLMVFTQTLRYADITNFNIKEVYIGQFIRGCLLLKFLQQKHPNIYAAFLDEFKIKSWERFFQQYFPLVHLALTNKGRKFTEITIPDNLLSDATAFIDKTAVKKEDEELVPFDFITLRANPLFHSSANSYRVIYDLFLVEKMYSGLYFIIKQIVEARGLAANLKNIVSLEFSEQQMVYLVMNAIFQNSYRTFTGTDLDKRKIKGAPDYYAANDKRVFLVESKDVFLGAEIKESGNYASYERALMAKFYFEEKDSKVKPKAVLQQIELIRRILSAKLEFDNPGGVVIYPILVIHHTQLNVAGFNQLINRWFRSELKKLSDDGLNTKLVRPVTVIDISTLILYMDYFQSDRIPLHAMIDEYHAATDHQAQIIVGPNSSLQQELILRAVSFPHFIRSKNFNPLPPKLHDDMAKEVVAYKEL